MNNEFCEATTADQIRNLAKVVDSMIKQHQEQSEIISEFTKKLNEYAAYRDDQNRGESAKMDGRSLNENPYSWSKRSQQCSYVAWREGWFMEYGKQQKDSR